MARHKFLLLDTTTPAMFETWRELEYTRERFGLGSFRLVVPVDHAQAAALVKQKRVLIVRDDGVTQAARFWGMITGARKRYAAEAGLDLGEAGKGRVFVEVQGVSLLEYFLSGRVYAPGEVQALTPNGAGDYTTEWGGGYADVDDSPDSHDGDTSYVSAVNNKARVSFLLSAYGAGDNTVGAIRLRSVWRNVDPEARPDIVNTVAMMVKVPGYNQLHGSPESDGTYVAWGFTHPPFSLWEQVDDVVGAPDEDSSYISGAAVGAKASFVCVNIPALMSPRSVGKVTVTARARWVGTGDEKISLFLLIGLTLYDSSVFTLSASYADYTAAWTVNPSTGNHWTEAEINSMEVGVKVAAGSGGLMVYVTQIYLSVHYVFEYVLGDVVSTSYTLLSAIFSQNPATRAAWTDSDLDDLEVGLRVYDLMVPVRVTAVDVQVFARSILTTDHVDDVLKKWVKYNLVSGYAEADRLVSGFAVEADEHAGMSGDCEIAYNLLLERLMVLCKAYGIGMDVVGNWGGGATKLNAAASYTFQTCVPEGIDRTHDQAVVDDVIISRERGLVRTLEYRQEMFGERNAVVAVGVEASGIRLRQVVTTSPTPTGETRREGVLDVGGDTAAILTAVGTKFVGDEGLALETVRVECAAPLACVPLLDFVPGDQVSFYDLVLGIGPLQQVVQEISCRVDGDGVERYEVVLGLERSAQVAEDAGYRAAGKRQTLHVL